MYTSENNLWNVIVLIIQLYDSIHACWFTSRFLRSKFVSNVAWYCDDILFTQSRMRLIIDCRVTYDCRVWNALLRQRSRGILVSDMFTDAIFCTYKLKESRVFTRKANRKHRSYIRCFHCFRMTSTHHFQCQITVLYFFPSFCLI